ncbi:MAG: hypothetical protein HY866_15065 [Chloroflexi bacterium]|nr:hypothetical protein [Chloroflexota bacterium]
MRCLGRLIGLILALFFVSILPLSLWTFNTQRIALAGDTYERMFADEDFYAELAPRVLPALLEGLDSGEEAANEISMLQVIDHLSEKEWETISLGLVPPGWVEQEIDRNLNSFMGWLDGEQDLELVFQTEVLRRRLSGPPGENAMQMIAAALPDCTAEEEQQFAAYVDDQADSTFPYCRPQNSDLVNELGSLLTQLRQDTTEQLPETFDVLEEMREAAQAEAMTEQQREHAEKAFSDAELNRFRSGIRLYKRLLPLTLMIPLVLLSLIVIVAVRSSKSFFRWMGPMLITGSLFTLVPLFLLPFVINELSIEAEIEGGFAAGGALMAEVVGNRMVHLLVGTFTWPILGQSAALIGIGFLFMVLSVLLRYPGEPRETVPTVQYVVSPYQTPSGLVTPEALTRLDNTPAIQRTPPPEKRDN